MRIDKHQASQQVQRFQVSTKEQAKIQEKLATGKSINRASDDAAGLAMAVELERQIRSYRNATENVAAGMSVVSIADGGASIINDMLQRQRDLALQSSNGILNSDQREAINKEFQSLSEEIDRVSRSTQYNGLSLLDGTGLADGHAKIQVGDDGQIDLPAADLGLAGLGLGPEKVDSLDAAMRALSAVDTALNRVQDRRASQGSLHNRLETAMSNLQSQMVNTTMGLSRVEDLDFAQGLTEKMRTDILQDTNTATLSQFNQLSRSHLLALLH